MANYRAMSGGNWSDLARWNDDSGGSYAASTVLPGAGDIVYSNGFVVNMDLTTTICQELRSVAATGVSVGGRFVYTTCITLIADVAGSGSIGISTGFTVDCPANNTRYLIGNCYGGNISSATCCGVRMSGMGSLIVTGNSFGGNNTSIAGVASGLFLSSTGNITLNGNAVGSVISGSTFGEGISSYGGGTVTINGSAIRNNSAGYRQFGTGGDSYVNTLVNSGIAINAITITTGTSLIRECRFSLSSIRFTSDGAIQSHLLSGSSIIFTAAPNYPAASDVKAGISYGPSGIYTGTWNIPITAEDLLAAIEVSTNPIAERIRNCATVASTGAQLTAFKNN
ncbi:MAG: hypothetical protein MH137_11100 [Flavobacteriales bacterium]|nr:hypothetical protein [Flavobacteriales bacterium]